MSSRLSAADLQSGLSSFSGSDKLYKHWTGRVKFTEGVKWLADEASAYWLIDAIASWQFRPDVSREEFQSWKFRRLPEGAVLTCDDGDGNIVAKQEIEFTDFPLMEITLWCEFETIMLPSER